MIGAVGGYVVAATLLAAAAAGPVLALYPGAGPAGPPPAGSITVHTGQAALFERYDVVATPYAVLVDRAGRVGAAEPVGSRAALRDLLARSGVTSGALR